MHYRRASLLAFFLLLTLLPLATVRGAVFAPARVDLRADPDRLPADGKSQSTIVAEVATISGAPVPDGTIVRFTSSLGTIVSPVQTIGGLAQTTLTAGSESGFATVSAIVAGTRQTITVTFSALPGSRVAGERIAELRADEIAYSADRCLLVATWHATLKYRFLTITADSIQYDVVPNIVRAQGNVTIASPTKKLHADALRWDLMAARGRLIAFSQDKPQRLEIKDDRLDTKPDVDDKEALWEPIATDETRTWVKAKQALVDPGQRIILDHAVIYVDDKPVLGMRRQVLRPTPNRAIFSDVLGFSSYGGIRLDFPYYYRASAHDLGSLFLRHNAFDGVGDGLGWSLGLKEEYHREGKLDGALTFNDLLHPGRDISFEHRQRLGLLSLSLDADSSSLPGTDYRFRSQSLGLAYPLMTGSLSLQLGGSSYNDSTERSIDLGYIFDARQIGGGLTLAPSLHLRQTRRVVPGQEVVVDPATGEPLTLNTNLTGRTSSTTLDVGVFARPRKFGPGLTLNSTVNTGYTMVFQGRGAAYLDARFGLDKVLTEGGRLSLTYQLSLEPAAAQTGLFTGGHQTLSLTGNGKIKGATISVNLSHDVGGNRQYGWLTVQKPLPFGKDALGQPLWTTQFAHLFTRYGAFGATSTRFSLIRALGHMTLSLNYSPQGQSAYGTSRPWINPFAYGYTYSGGRHLWIELGSAID